VKSKKKGYNPSDYLTVLEEIPPEYSFLSAGKVFNLQSKYPIFLLNCTHEKSTWRIIQKNITKLENKNKQQDINEKDVEIFLQNNLDINFEIEIFDDVISDYYYFRIDEEIYCYGASQINKKNIIVRFFFDIKKFIY